MVSAVVWRKHNQTNQWRLQHAVKIRPWQTRPLAGADEAHTAEVDLELLPGLRVGRPER